jgi:hypothetical protein
MAYSSFYTDGYRDGLRNNKASPPPPLRRNDGQSTNVFADEYMTGWVRGVNDRVSDTLDLDDRPKTRLDVGYQIYLANTPDPFPKSFDEWLNS